MVNLLSVFERSRFRKDKSEIDDSFRSGDEIVVSIMYTDKGKERIQTFKGNVIQRRHTNSLGETFTVMKTTEGVRVEETFYLNSPFIKSIIVLNRAKVRRARLFYLRDAKGKKAKLKYKIIKKNKEDDVLREPLVDENLSAEQKSENVVLNKEVLENSAEKKNEQVVVDKE